MAVNVVAVDNAPELLEKIEGIFRNMAEVSLLGSFEEAVAVVEFVKENPVDMVFTDIVMPDISGMELASYVRMKYDSPFIVFVTAHMEYSVKCYRYHAWQYITKDSIRTLIPETMDSLIQHLQAHKSNYYMIEGANDLIRIAYDQIQYLSKDGKYTLFYTDKPEVFRERRALSKVIEDMQQVDDAFIMTDKSYGVNIRHVLRLKDHMLTMRNGDSVPVSLPRYQQVKKAISDYWGRRAWK